MHIHLYIYIYIYILYDYEYYLFTIIILCCDGHLEGAQGSWAATFIPMPVPKIVCRTILQNK